MPRAAVVWDGPAETCVRRGGLRDQGAQGTSEGEASLSAITARLDALASTLEDSGASRESAVEGRGRSARVVFGHASAPRTRAGRSRTRSRSRSRSTSRARVRSGGVDSDEEEEVVAPVRASLFSDSVPRARRATPDPTGWATAGALGGPLLSAAAARQAAAAAAGTQAARADAQETLRALHSSFPGGSPSSQDALTGTPLGRASAASAAAAAAAAVALRPPPIAAPAGESVRLRRPAFHPTPPVGAPADGEARQRARPASGSPPDAAAAGGSRAAARATAAAAASSSSSVSLNLVPEPDRAQLLGAALADIVKARSDRERFEAVSAPHSVAAPLSGGGDRDAGAAAARAIRRAALLSEDAGVSTALNAALVEQGRFRSGPAQQAARDRDWESTAGATAQALAARKARQASLGGGGGGGGADARGGARGAPPSSPHAQPPGPLHRTASRDAVESAGLSLVRALSASRGGGRQQPAPTPEREPQEDEGREPRLRGSRSLTPPSPLRGGEHQPALPRGGVPALAAVRVVVASGEQTLCVLRAHSGRTERSIHALLDDHHSGPTSPVLSIAVLSALELVVTACDVRSADGQVGTLLRCWPLRAGGDAPQQPPIQLRLPPSCGRVAALAALDERRLGAACACGLLAVWNAADTHGARPDIVCGEGYVLSPLQALQALPCAEVAAAGQDGVVRVWGTWDGALEAELKGHISPVTALACLNQGALLASGAQDGCVRVWLLASGDCLATLTAHVAAVTALLGMRQGRLASAGADGSLCVWRAEEGTQEHSLRRFPGGGVAALAALDDEHALALGRDGRLRVVLCEDAQPLMELGEEGGITAVAVAGGAARPLGQQGEADRKRCGPVRIRDRLWCFAGGSRLC